MKNFNKIAFVTAALMAATAYEPASAFTFKAPSVIQQSDTMVVQVGKKQRRRNRAIAGAAALGLLGAAIIHQNRKNRRVYEDDYVDEVEYERPRRRLSAWERHVQRCYRAYKSYDEDTDTDITYGGEVRRCRK